MNQKKSFRSSIPSMLVISLAVVAVYPRPAHADDDVVWDRVGGTNNWSNGSNWNPDIDGLLFPNGPINGNGVHYNVTIPSNFTVNFDIASFSTVTTFQLNSNATLNVLPGTDLSVTNTAVISGLISANGGNFFALNSGTVSFGGNSARLSAINVGTIQLSATAYSSTG